VGEGACGWGGGVHSGFGVAEVSGSGFVSAGDGEAEARHVGVGGLILAVGNLIGFVPDAYGTVVAYVLIEGLPGGEANGVAGLGLEAVMKFEPSWYISVLSRLFQHGEMAKVVRRGYPSDVTD
jgi:hypothetical protein